MPTVHQIKSKVDFLLCSEFVVVLHVPLLIVVHLFADQLVSARGITILM
jgi:hypothetical protein